jgi:hypothetical protein
LTTTFGGPILHRAASELIPLAVARLKTCSAFSLSSYQTNFVQKLAAFGATIEMQSEHFLFILEIVMRMRIEPEPIEFPANFYSAYEPDDAMTAAILWRRPYNSRVLLDRAVRTRCPFQCQKG